MDVEELHEDSKPSRNLTTDLPRLTLTKNALYGRNSSGLTQVNLTQQPTLAYQPQQAPAARQQYQPVAFQQPLAFMQSHQSAVVNPGNSSTPPLFVGFMTNDVSMNQIRDLFTSYTKAANDSKADYRLTDKKSDGLRRGRFDVRQLDDSDSEDEEDRLGKRDLKAKRRREGRAAKEAAVGVDKDVIKKGAVKLKADESSGVSAPTGVNAHQDSSKKGGLFDIKKPSHEAHDKKNSFSFGNENKKENKQGPFIQPDPIKSSDFGASEKTAADTQSGFLKSSLFANSGFGDDNKKTPSPIGNQAVGISGGLSLFKNDGQG